MSVRMLSKNLAHQFVLSRVTIPSALPNCSKYNSLSDITVLCRHIDVESTDAQRFRRLSLSSDNSNVTNRINRKFERIEETAGDVYVGQWQRSSEQSRRLLSLFRRVDMFVKQKEGNMIELFCVLLFVITFLYIVI